MTCCTSRSRSENGCGAPEGNVLPWTRAKYATPPLERAKRGPATQNAGVRRPLLRLSACALLLWSLAAPASAQDSANSQSPTRLSKTYVWFSASATLLTASLGGIAALHVDALYGQSRELASVSPTQSSLKRQAERAEIVADALFCTAFAFGISTLWLAFMADWNAPPSDPNEHAQHGLQLSPTAGPHGASLLLTGVLP